MRGSARFSMGWDFGIVAIILLAMVPSVLGSSFVGLPWNAVAETSQKTGTRFPELVESIHEWAGCVADQLKSSFKVHKDAAEERFQMRKRALSAITAAQVDGLNKVLERTQQERVKEEQDKEEYDGYTADQLEFMKTHYATIRPSPTLLRQPKKEAPAVSEVRPFTRSLTDDIGERVLAPTHEDELEIAKRRESFRIATRLREHRIQKSHTH